ncbi:MAG TPA: hypothetical protein VK217_00625 [Acidimicrobiales bacterium]|nr:hypothetical protein [Acidimicrobiales bacterium]
MEINCDELTVTEVNRALRALKASDRVNVIHPRGRDNLGVALRTPAAVHFKGSVGAYCGGMNNGASITIEGNAGNGLGENSEAGSIVVTGSVSTCAGASMRGGTITVMGDAGNRLGISMKGGTLILAGDAGPMAGFMIQAGSLIIRGDAGRGLGDSMYEGEIYVGGCLGELGNDAVLTEMDEGEREALAASLTAAGVARAADWKKIVAGRQLWHFRGTHEELAIWMKL